MEVKDYFYNLTKTASYIFSDLMTTKSLKSKLFDKFFSFINNEYSLLLLRKK
jgi:hypothetical protein